MEWCLPQKWLLNLAECSWPLAHAAFIAACGLQSSALLQFTHLHTHTYVISLAVALISTARALLHSKIINVNLTFVSVKISPLVSVHITPHMSELLKCFWSSKRLRKVELILYTHQHIDTVYSITLTLTLSLFFLAIPASSMMIFLIHSLDSQ